MRFSFVLLLLFPLFLLAQPFQGQRFLGGSLDLSIRSVQDDETRSSFSFNPLFGGMLSNRFALGASIDFGFGKTTGNGFVVIDPFTGLPIFTNSSSKSVFF